MKKFLSGTLMLAMVACCCIFSFQTATTVNPSYACADDSNCLPGAPKCCDGVCRPKHAVQCTDGHCCTGPVASPDKCCGALCCGGLLPNCCENISCSSSPATCCGFGDGFKCGSNPVCCQNPNHCCPTGGNCCGAGCCESGEHCCINDETHCKPLDEKCEVMPAPIPPKPEITPDYTE